MTGFEPRTSGIGNDRSTNWATQPLPINAFLAIGLADLKSRRYAGDLFDGMCLSGIQSYN